MEIMVNGKACTLKEGATVTDALKALGAVPIYTAVEVDGRLVPKEDWDAMALKKDMRLEVVSRGYSIRRRLKKRQFSPLGIHRIQWQAPFIAPFASAMGKRSRKNWTLALSPSAVSVALAPISP